MLAAPNTNVSITITHKIHHAQIANYMGFNGALIRIYGFNRYRFNKGWDDIVTIVVNSEVPADLERELRDKFPGVLYDDIVE